MYTIVIVFCVINFVNSFVKLFMLRRVVEFDVLSFMRISHLRVLLMSIPLAIYYYIYMVYAHPQSVVGHIVGLLSAYVFFGIVVMAMGLDSSEREKVKIFVAKKMNRK